MASFSFTLKESALLEDPPLDIAYDHGDEISQDDNTALFPTMKPAQLSALFSRVSPPEEAQCIEEQQGTL